MQRLVSYLEYAIYRLGQYIHYQLSSAVEGIQSRRTVYVLFISG